MQGAVGIYRTLGALDRQGGGGREILRDFSKMARDRERPDKRDDHDPYSAMTWMAGH